MNSHARQMETLERQHRMHIVQTVFDGIWIVGGAALLATLASCAAPPAPKPAVEYKTRTVDTACTWTKIITIGKEDKLSDETAKQILAHDRAWVANCRK